MINLITKPEVEYFCYRLEKACRKLGFDKLSEAIKQRKNVIKDFLCKAKWTPEDMLYRGEWFHSHTPGQDFCLGPATYSKLIDTYGISISEPGSVTIGYFMEDGHLDESQPNMTLYEDGFWSAKPYLGYYWKQI